MERQVRLLIIFVLLIQMATGSIAPKHEFRAAWVATVQNLDFPRSKTSVTAQKNEITSMLNSLQQNGFNAVVFQVRPACDALYDSNYEPWSHYLTGVSGKVPDPYYDPLEYFIAEAHARGIELHAWFNPYRVISEINPSNLHSSHVYHQHPEWVLSITSGRSSSADFELGIMYANTLFLNSENLTRETTGTTTILDPGKAAVREYVLKVYMDVVNRYDVDGIHMDDYFYPYDGINDEDAATFTAEARGFSDINDWRRDNINLMVASIYDSIQAVKPWVKFGVSPFGIWKSGLPTGIVGLSSYSAIYCDPIAWLQAGKVDYITPQLYWPFGGGQDYGALMPWWADSISTHNRHLYVGHAPYRMTSYHNWTAEELPRQIRLNRTTDGCEGSVFFRIWSGVLNNPKGFLDSLNNDLYQYPALTPPMLWKDSIPPEPPDSVYASFNGSECMVTWQPSRTASDGDLPTGYIIYRSMDTPINTNDPANIAAIVPSEDTEYTDFTNYQYSYAVAALDLLNNESPLKVAEYLGFDWEESVNQLSDQLILHDNFPNPFNPVTNITYELPASGLVEIHVCDITGRTVETLVNQIMPAGLHSVSWRAAQYSSGVYFYRITSGSYSAVNKMILMK